MGAQLARELYGEEEQVQEAQSSSWWPWGGRGSKVATAASDASPVGPDADCKHYDLPQGDATAASSTVPESLECVDLMAPSVEEQGHTKTGLRPDSPDAKKPAANGTGAKKFTKPSVANEVHTEKGR